MNSTKYRERSEMKIKLITIGKTNASYLKEGMDIYLKRLEHYMPFEYMEIPDLRNTKNKTENQIRTEEGQILLNTIDPSDQLVLLDENGKSYSSESFSNYLEKMVHQGIRNLVFVVGGAYGFSQEVYGRSNGKLSLSDMTFSHQMVRLFFLEQLYRAQTILKGEPYHHK